MKISFFALAGLILSALIMPIGGYGQSSSDRGPHHVVIGAFAVEKNAVKCARAANRAQLPAKFEKNSSRNLYYVYVLTTVDKEAAISETKRLRAERKYHDAWVYHGNFSAEVHVASPILATDPQTNVEIKPEPPVVTASLNPVVESEKSSKVKDTDVATNPFMFKIVRATDQKVLTGEIELIDAAKAKKIMTYEGNKPVEVKVPQNADAEFLVVCKAFGYRKEQRSLKISKPEGEGISIDESGVTTVPFELVRLHKGDIAVMYNVYFFNDAAVMRPESNYELNTLVEMMEENSNCKIKIHGHTNGGAHGKIIYMGDEKNFFSLTGSTSGFGSAKKLSNARAQVIKDYLVSKGIEESRIAVKAWGGKRPLHDKHHTRASENARVEVEIMAD